MAAYVSHALFVYTEETEYLCRPMQENALDVQTDAVAFETLLTDAPSLLQDVNHVVVSGSVEVIKKIVQLAITHGFSMGIVPTAAQKNFIRFYDLPVKVNDAIELSLRADAPSVDINLCNGQILLFKATVGRIPLLDAPIDAGRMEILSAAVDGFRKFKLHQLSFTPTSGKQFTTAASGCMIVQHHKGSYASRLVAHDSAITDGMISTVISAPLSIIDYFKFLVSLFRTPKGLEKLPLQTGYIKSEKITIETRMPVDVVVDGECTTRTPLECETVPAAVHLNVGAAMLKESKPGQPVREQLKVDGLPQGKELEKARKKKKIPFFSYASEERFRDLFISLRTDAQINSIYMVLMVLSTMLATVGLYQNSAAVIIGAMLLAPLMAPIVSLSMGVLRGDDVMYRKSMGKISLGVVIALLASALIALIFPHEPVTDQMQARLNPTLLDLAVAIISGVAAAYSKSFKEIIQSLAGVAIAVALVPPLSVAGIGIGRLDFNFFSEAFLLFATNLVGILIAATLTFRVLGYSPAVKAKRHFGIVFLLLLLIAVPLYMSYENIVEKVKAEDSWKHERFLVNGKYIIVKKARMSPRRGKTVINMNILVRETLTREDLTILRKKIDANFSKETIIRVNTIYVP